MADKRLRLRLAKAEMWMLIACSHAVADIGKPNHPDAGDAEPPSPAESLAEKYDLSLADMARLAEQIGAELERRGMKAGYDDIWDD